MQSPREYTEHERRQLLIARLPNVETLNGGGVISSQERENAERAFIRYYMDKPEADRPERWVSLGALCASLRSSSPRLFEQHGRSLVCFSLFGGGILNYRRKSYRPSTAKIIGCGWKDFRVLSVLSFEKMQEYETNTFKQFIGFRFLAGPRDLESPIRFVFFLGSLRAGRVSASIRLN